MRGAGAAPGYLRVAPRLQFDAPFHTKTSLANSKSKVAFGRVGVLKRTTKGIRASFNKKKEAMNLIFPDEFEVLNTRSWLTTP